MSIPTSTPRRRPFIGRILRWTLLLLVGLPLLGSATLWFLGPSLIAPVSDFDQGPGGAIAYVSLYNQFHGQAKQILTGQDVRLELNEAEFSGMVSSALLSGRYQIKNPIRKVRADLHDGRVSLNTVLQISHQSVPERFQGPLGLRLDLEPQVAKGGTLSLRIQRAALGRIPLPRGLIQWIGRQPDLTLPGFDPLTATITLPISDAVSAQLGRPVQVKQFTVNDQTLSLVVNLK